MNAGNRPFRRDRANIDYANWKAASSCRIWPTARIEHRARMRSHDLTGRPPNDDDSKSQSAQIPTTVSGRNKMITRPCWELGMPVPLLQHKKFAEPSVFTPESLL